MDSTNISWSFQDGTKEINPKKMTTRDPINLLTRKEWASKPKSKPKSSKACLNTNNPKDFQCLTQNRFNTLANERNSHVISYELENDQTTRVDSQCTIKQTAICMENPNVASTITISLAPVKSATTCLSTPTSHLSAFSNHKTLNLDNPKTPPTETSNILSRVTHIALQIQIVQNPMAPTI